MIVTTASTFVPTAEAAFIAEVSDREMNRVVDEHILPATLVRTENGRTFTRLAAAFARFYFRTEDQFVARQRLRILEELTARLELRGDKDLVFDLAVLPNDLSWRVELPYGGLADATEAIHASVNRVQQVKEASRLVSTDPDVMGGMPVFVGTRVPVENIAASLDKGIGKLRLVTSWPFLTEKHFEAAKIYMQVHPRRGRPRRLSELNPHWKIKSSEEVRSATKA